MGHQGSGGQLRTRNRMGTDQRYNQRIFCAYIAGESEATKNTHTHKTDNVNSACFVLNVLNHHYLPKYL